MPTPRPIEIIVRGLLRHGARILACRNLKHGYLYLPGGHVEFGEPAGRALERELEEETGLRVRAGPCVLVTEGLFETRRKPHHELNLVFHVEHSEGWALEGTPPEIASQEKGLAFEWVDLASVADLDLRPEPIRAWLASGGEFDSSAARCCWIGVQQ